VIGPPVAVAKTNVMLGAVNRVRSVILSINGWPRKLFTSDSIISARIIIVHASTMQRCEKRREPFGGIGGGYVDNYYCVSNGRRLSASEENNRGRGVRLGAINIARVHGSNATVKEVARALCGLVINATVSLIMYGQSWCSSLKL
jgi:hypothetical protein